MKNKIMKKITYGLTGEMRDVLYDGCVDAFNYAAKENPKQNTSDKQFERFVKAVWKSASRYIQGPKPVAKRTKQK